MLTLQISLSAIAGDSVEGKTLEAKNTCQASVSDNSRGHEADPLNPCLSDDAVLSHCGPRENPTERPTGRPTAESLMTTWKSLLSFIYQRTHSISNTHTQLRACRYEGQWQLQIKDYTECCFGQEMCLKSCNQYVKNVLQDAFIQSAFKVHISSICIFPEDQTCNLHC